MSLEQCSGLALRLISALSESEFSTTICELKRHMDRQSQLFLQGQTSSISEDSPSPAHQSTDSSSVFNHERKGAGEQGAADTPEAVLKPPSRIARRGRGRAACSAPGRKAQAPASLRAGRTSSDGVVTAAASSTSATRGVRGAARRTTSSATGWGTRAAVTTPKTSASRTEAVLPAAVRVAEGELGRGAGEGAFDRKPKQRVLAATPVEVVVGTREAHGDYLEITAEHRRDPRNNAPVMMRSKTVTIKGRSAVPEKRQMSGKSDTNNVSQLGVKPSAHSLASRQRASKRVLSEATFVKLPRKSHHLLDLPSTVLLRVFRMMAPRERLLPVSRRWLDLGRTPTLWQHLGLGARGAWQDVCLTLQRMPLLQRLTIADRKDVNHILETLAKSQQLLQHVHLERCGGPGGIAVEGIQALPLRAVELIDTPLSTRLVAHLAESCASFILCRMTATVDQAAVFFGCVLKAAVSADEGGVNPFQSFNVTFSASRAASQKGTLLWRRKSHHGELSFSGVILQATFVSTKNQN